MRMLTAAFFFFGLCCPILMVSCQNDELIKRNSTDFEIFLTDRSNNSQLEASDLLQHYIARMTGVEIPISHQGGPGRKNLITIDNNPDLHPDGFMIEPRADGLFISGGDHKGVVYAVISLLESWGCRKYSPHYEIVPKLKVIYMPKTILKDEPANNYRIINGRFCLDSEYQNWQRLDLIQDRFADKFYVHTFNRLIPWEDNFDSHPEFFSEVNGRRIKDQLCLSNHEVLQLSIEKLTREMELQPDKKLWSVSQNDNFTYCQCEDCQRIIDEEGSPAGPVIRFVNEIAKEFPDKTISTLAYQYSRLAPKKTKPLENVQVMLCTIELNRSVSIAQDPRSQSFLKDIEDWGRIAQHIYLWDYTVNFSHHISPFPNLHVLQPNIQLFTNNNVHEHFQQSNTDVGHEFSELKSYLISRLLWNPEVNADSVIHDFTEGYYGDAAPMIMQYISGIQGDIRKTEEWLDIYGHPTAYENSFLAEDKVINYLELLNQACKQVEDDSARLVHVKTTMLPIQYAAMEIGKNHMFESRGWYEVVNDVYKPRIAMNEMLEEFIQTCRVAGVNTINEAGLKPEDYYQATKRFIDVQVEGNIAFRKPVSANISPSLKYSDGNLDYLTNGVQGASDYKVHWLGWEAQSFSLTLDLGEIKNADKATLSSLYDPKSWIFHPSEVKCFVSEDGQFYKFIDSKSVEGDQRIEEVTRNYTFNLDKAPVRFIRMDIAGTMENPRWHASAGGKSWVFVDEIVVR